MNIRKEDIQWKQWIGNFLFTLLMLAIMLDPTNTVLHLKDLFFVLLVGYNMLVFKPDWKYLVHISLIFFAVTLAYLFAEMQGNHVDYEKLLAIYKSFSPLVMLLWIKHYDAVKLSIFPGIAACLMLFVLYIMASSAEEVEYAIYLFMGKHDDMVMMSHRYFLGHRMFGMYLKSFVSLMFAMYFVFYTLFNTTSHWKRALSFLGAIVFTGAFLVSGTRSTMLLPFAMIGLASYNKISQTRHVKYFLYPTLVLFAILFLCVIVVLASEKDEFSNMIKYAHLTSYAKLFTEHPEYLVLGQGPSTQFYTIGFKRFVNETEWTYIELVRSYGICSLLILGVVLYPLRTMFKHIKEDAFTLGITATYIMYLLIAGTNPLLLSSTGMIMILISYSYAEKLCSRSSLNRKL